MESTRLHGKVLLPLGNTTMLGAVIEQIRHSERVGEIIVATPDDEIGMYMIKRAIDVFKGSENDVLDRFYQCAKKFKLKHIVRITSDCPLIDPEMIDEAVLFYETGGYDYVNNFSKKFLDGQAVEVFSWKVLQTLHRKPTSYQREHVTPRAYETGLFKTGVIVPPYDYDYKLTVDTKSDYELVKKIYSSIPYRPIHIPDILRIHDEL